MEDPSECPEVVPKEASEKINRKKLRKIFGREFFEKFTYTTVVQVFRMNTVSKILEPGNNGILSKDIKQFEQRRV